MSHDSRITRSLVALAMAAGIWVGRSSTAEATQGASSTAPSAPASDATKGQATGEEASTQKQIDTGNRNRTADELRADMRKIEQRISEVSREVREETASGTRKLREESRAKFERDLEILKADLATLREKTETASNRAGTRITRGIGDSLSALGQKLGDLGTTLRKDADASSVRGTPPQATPAR